MTKPLFAWDELEDSPSLSTLRELPVVLPDERLLASLRRARGQGRDDYPVHVLWGVVVLSIACRHPDMEACLAELRRNAGLRRLIGIETESQTPHGWNMSRFLATWGEEPHRTLLQEVSHVLIRELGRVVIDLGKDTAGDATQLSGRATEEKAQTAEIAAGPSPAPLPPAGGLLRHCFHRFLANLAAFPASPPD